MKLKIGMASNPRTQPIFQGLVERQGLELECEDIHGSELFYRQLKSAEFDVAEMSMSSFMIITSQGDTRFVGLPIFTMRKFFHTGILVRTDSGIELPEDLKGKRVGVPEYQQTAMLWIRGILQHEFGVAPPDMTFWMERTPNLSHGGLTGFAPPPGVTINQIPAESSLGEMVASGELDSALLYLSDRNLVDRSRVDLNNHPEVKPLFSDPRAEGIRYHEKTGILPINHCMVIRRELAGKNPGLAEHVYRLFVRANELCEAQRMEHMAYHVDTGLVAEDVLRTQIVKYGMVANRRVLETAANYSHEQGLTPRLIGVEELFAPELMNV